MSKNSGTSTKEQLGYGFESAKVYPVLYLIYLAGGRIHAHKTLKSVVGHIQMKYPQLLSFEWDGYFFGPWSQELYDTTLNLRHQRRATEILWRAHNEPIHHAFEITPLGQYLLTHNRGKIEDLIKSKSKIVPDILCWSLLRSKYGLNWLMLMSDNQEELRPADRIQSIRPLNVRSNLKIDKRLNWNDIYLIPRGWKEVRSLLGDEKKVSKLSEASPLEVTVMEPPTDKKILVGITFKKERILNRYEFCRITKSEISEALNLANGGDISEFIDDEERRWCGNVRAGRIDQSKLKLKDQYDGDVGRETLRNMTSYLTLLERHFDVLSERHGVIDSFLKKLSDETLETQLKLLIEPVEESCLTKFEIEIPKKLKENIVTWAREDERIKRWIPDFHIGLMEHIDHLIQIREYCDVKWTERLSKPELVI